MHTQERMEAIEIQELVLEMESPPPASREAGTELAALTPVELDPGDLELRGELAREAARVISSTATGAARRASPRPTRPRTSRRSAISIIVSATPASSA